MAGENPQHKNVGKALLPPRAGNGPPETHRYRGRVRINQIRIQVEPRTSIVRPEALYVGFRVIFYFLSQNQIKKEILT